MRPIVWCGKSTWTVTLDLSLRSRRRWRENVTKAVRGRIRAEDELIA